MVGPRAYRPQAREGVHVPTSCTNMNTYSNKNLFVKLEQVVYIIEAGGTNMNANGPMQEDLAVLERDVDDGTYVEALQAHLEQAHELVLVRKGAREPQRDPPATSTT
ncbi:hypothetical protein CLAIMM_14926 [Cladophialophora immunda]|nr:hypothetical protein CLAIMM_14926 [Cladophialophora immunda]